jgi:hypothetical protein
MLRFAFPALLIPILKDPGHFARLRVHFLISLSGKYSVTLYELLESVANKVEPVLDVSIDTFLTARIQGSRGKVDALSGLPALCFGTLDTANQRQPARSWLYR